MENSFKKPKNAFLLIMEGEDGDIYFRWWNTEELLIEDAKERMERGETVLYAMEIDGSRDIVLPPPKRVYHADDFALEMKLLYDTVVERTKGERAVLYEIDAYPFPYRIYVNRTSDGFQCSALKNQTFESMYDLGMDLFHRLMEGVGEWVIFSGKPICVLPLSPFYKFPIIYSGEEELDVDAIKEGDVLRFQNSKDGTSVFGIACEVTGMGVYIFDVWQEHKPELLLAADSVTVIRCPSDVDEKELADLNRLLQAAEEQNRTVRQYQYYHASNDN